MSRVLAGAGARVSGCEAFLADVVHGLSRPQRTLPCKYLYDAVGAELFERICGLDAYYPTRTERRILRGHGAEMAALVGPHARVVEFGSGSGTKTELLLEALDAPTAYVPVDISREQLLDTARRLGQRFPALVVQPVCADYSRAFQLPPEPPGTARTLVFFPGSTIGNFEPRDAVRFLADVHERVGRGGAVLMGVDRQKDVHTLVQAYDDPDGVTAAFNLNLLVRINRELGANFQIEHFAHRAVYDPLAGRIEMHLVSRRHQTVGVPGVDGRKTAFAFRRGDHIVTEHSYKYTLHGFATLVRAAGLSTERVWSDPDELFSVCLLRA